MDGPGGGPVRHAHAAHLGFGFESWRAVPGVAGGGVITKRENDVPAGGGFGRVSMWADKARRAATSTLGASTWIEAT